MSNLPAILRQSLTTALICCFLIVSGQNRSEGADPSNLVGIRAPEFRLSGSDGQTHRLTTDLRSGPMIVVWFPKAYTGNVERMLKSIDTAATELRPAGVQLVAISCDKSKYLQPFSQELGLNFLILADPTRTTSIQWTTVHSGREIPERWAFFIGRDGLIKAVVTELEAAKAGDILTRKAKELGW